MGVENEKKARGPNRSPKAVYVCVYGAAIGRENNLHSWRSYAIVYICFCR